MKNVSLLREVRKFILEEPRRFTMQMFAAHVPHVYSPCGTVACISGWSVALADKAKFDEMLHDDCSYKAWEDEGQRVLKITDRQVQYLFYVEGWPKKFRAYWRNTKTREEAAQVAAKRINHFIKTGR